MSAVRTSVGLSQEQLEMRKTGISASEVPAVLGLSPFASPLDIFLEKLGLVEPSEPSDAMMAGNYLEDGIAQWYADRTGSTLERRGTVAHPSEPWRLATIDRLRTDRPAIVECKLVMGSAAAWGEEDEGEAGVPEYVRIQVLTQMDVLGIHEAEVAALIPSAKKQKMRIYPVTWDAELAEYAATLVTDFWRRYVEARVQPEITDSKRFGEYLRKRFPRNEGGMLPASVEAIEIADLRAAEAAIVSEHQRVVDECDNRLKVLIGDADGIEGVATYKAPAQGLVGWKAVAEALGASKELIEQHRGAPSRRFLFRFKGDV